MFQIPVYRDGNIIDLGYHSLQVADACSGLRYIYPLLSLSFLAAYMFRAPLWQRAFVFFSSIPITVAMNSIRIGVVGVTVEYWGTQALDGTIHFFEGWGACAGILASEIYFLAHISGKTFSDAAHFPILTAKPAQRQQAKSGDLIKLATSLLLLSAAGMASFFIPSKAEIIPDRDRFITFPTQIGPWQGRTSLLDAEVERGLMGLDDYLLSDYRGPDGKIVNLYVGYYASERKGGQPHSPDDCIPASGWRITNLQPISYTDNGVKLPLKRAVIEKGPTKELVYYWFDERGRKTTNTNAYLEKWYLRVDALFTTRSDGALVRLITQIQIDETERDADERLRAFMRDALPELSEYLPDQSASQAQSVHAGPKSTQ
jgi:exosortase D (VPLPA-CTERM-specific)